MQQKGKGGGYNNAKSKEEEEEFPKGHGLRRPLPPGSDKFQVSLGHNLLFSLQKSRRNSGIKEGCEACGCVYRQRQIEREKPRQEGRLREVDTARLVYYHSWATQVFSVMVPPQACGRAHWEV